MPPGYRLEEGGAVEQSAKGQRSVLAVIPVMFILMLFILMVQLQSVQKHAIIEATVHRLRPILLTAAAAVLGLIPIAGEVFWGPMAYAMMGGLLIATVLTLFFLPALYAMWYRVPVEPTHT